MRKKNKNIIFAIFFFILIGKYFNASALLTKRNQPIKKFNYLLDHFSFIRTFESFLNSFAAKMENLS